MHLDFEQDNMEGFEDSDDDFVPQVPDHFAQVGQHENQILDLSDEEHYDDDEEEVGNSDNDDESDHNDSDES
jgi:hypothetical protein